MDLEEARRQVQEHVNKNWIANGHAATHGPMIVAGHIAKPYGWVFFYAPQKYIETRDLVYDSVLTLLGIGGAAGAAGIQDDFPTPSVTVVSPGYEDSGPIFTHFTDANGASGITGYPVETLQVGQSIEVTTLRFGTGQNPFLSNNPGDIFVTPIGPGASSGQLGRIGISPDRQAFAIEFDAQTAFEQGVRPVQTAQGISTIPANSVIKGNFTLTRLK
jgi:hypothetical protein